MLLSLQTGVTNMAYYTLRVLGDGGRITGKYEFRATHDREAAQMATEVLGDRRGELVGGDGRVHLPVGQPLRASSRQSDLYR